MESRNVRELLCLRGPQELAVNPKAPTSGCSLPLFALNSAHRRPPWLRILGWAGLLSAGPGEAGKSAHSPGPRVRSTVFSARLCFVSVTPLERDFCGSKHTFIILSPLLIPSPSGINFLAEKRSGLFRDAPKHIPLRNGNFWVRCLQWQPTFHRFCLALWRFRWLLFQKLSSVEEKKLNRRANSPRS